MPTVLLCRLIRMNLWQNPRFYAWKRSPAPLTELNIKRKGMCLSLHMFVSLIIYLCTLFIFMASIKDIITMLCCVVDGSVRFESINDNYYWLLNIVNNNINNGYLRLWLLQWYGCMANNFYSYSYLCLSEPHTF